MLCCFGKLTYTVKTRLFQAYCNSRCGALDQGGSVRALFVDFSNAFDRVDHNILLAKLKDRPVM